MPGNIAGNHFPEVLLAPSSHPSEFLQVIQNETLKDVLSLGWGGGRHCAVNARPTHASVVDIPKLGFVLWRKMALWKMLYAKSHFRDANPTCPTKHYVFFYKSPTVNV
jgi:hypothetical protein